MQRPGQERQALLKTTVMAEPGSLQVGKGDSILESTGQLTGFASSNSHLPIKLNCIKFLFWLGILEPVPPEQSSSEGLILRKTNLEQ